ncbi:MAG TPA: GyrI-like domain-containing protein [Roseiarcus sp.]|nr:GyrI-like domain-containing protein [Roseiarcus sp.]
MPALLCAIVIAAFAAGDAAKAQSQPATPAAQTPAAAPAPSAAPPAPAPATPAVPPAAAGASPNAPAAPATPQAQTPAAPLPAPPQSDAAETPTIQLAARPAAYIEGKANWDEGFSAINNAIAAVDAELAKAGMRPAGRPLAVFTETDDTSFRFRAMVPIDAIPDGKTSLSDTVKFGQTPAGKAMKFEHRGSYEDIDSTYEAITAFLDEKGLESQNLFYEEYLNDVKSPDDPTLEVDIYVLLK